LKLAATVADPLSGSQAAVVAAIRLAMRPLIRLAITSQVSYPTLAEMLKALFVNVAERDFALYGQRSSDSRLHVLTGVHRKDVKRLRTGPPGKSILHTVRPSIAGAVLMAWSDNPAHLGPDGAPVPLPVTSTGTDPGAVSFESVVRSVSSDIAYRPLLDEWLHRGVVKVQRDGRVVLDVLSAIRAMPAAAAIDLLGITLSQHAEVMVDNLSPEANGTFSGHTSEKGLSRESVAELLELANTQISAAIQQVNNRAAALRRRDAGRAEANLLFTLGAFTHTKPAERHAGPNEVKRPVAPTRRRVQKATPDPALVPRAKRPGKPTAAKRRTGA
jgi:hypothetical protein